jgi:cytochrome c
LDPFELNKIRWGIPRNASLCDVAERDFRRDFQACQARQTGLPASSGASSGGGRRRPAAPSFAPIGQRLTESDVKKGEADTKPCQACHNFEKGAGAKIGPPLYGVVDRPKGSVAGFDYSEAIKSKGGEWTYADLDQFLTNPKAYAQGTKMTFAGEPDPAKRADIIDYLHTLSDKPEPLPAK